MPTPKKRTPKRRDSLAKALENKAFRHRVIISKRVYKRPREKTEDANLVFDIDGNHN